jgi:hypothetical protein
VHTRDDVDAEGPLKKEEINSRRREKSSTMTTMSISYVLQYREEWKE